MFSYHPDKRNLDKPSFYAEGWQAYPSSCISLSLAICRVATSPIIFHQGRRIEANFHFADWVGLDFDEGVSLSSITQAFCDRIHVIGITKSHQLWKGHYPPCDRFRVWLKLADTITKVADYKATVKNLVYQYDSDPACVGAAQMFMPCVAIHSVSDTGYGTDVVRAKETTYQKPREKYNGQIPPWVRKWLKGDLDWKDGGRNRHVFKTAVDLTKNGWKEADIVDLVMGSDLPINQSPRLWDEVRKAVKSGRARALREEEAKSKG